VTIPPPIAHVGHWYEGVLYLAPIVIIAVVLLWQGRKHDGEDQADGGEPWA
jgi:hypothetical protein